MPALVFGAGAMGFFALPYTVIAYPLVFMVLPRLWRVAHRHNYVTGADFSCAAATAARRWRCWWR